MSVTGGSDSHVREPILHAVCRHDRGEALDLVVINEASQALQRNGKPMTSARPAAVCHTTAHLLSCSGLSHQITVAPLNHRVDHHEPLACRGRGRIISGRGSRLIALQPLAQDIPSQSDPWRGRSDLL